MAVGIIPTLGLLCMEKVKWRPLKLLLPPTKIGSEGQYIFWEVGVLVEINVIFLGT
jgi:hypothetical protein